MFPRFKVELGIRSVFSPKGSSLLHHKKGKRNEITTQFYYYLIIAYLSDCVSDISNDTRTSVGKLGPPDWLAHQKAKVLLFRSVSSPKYEYKFWFLRCCFFGIRTLQCFQSKFFRISKNIQVAPIAHWNPVGTSVKMCYCPPENGKPSPVGARVKIFYYPPE